MNPKFTTSELTESLLMFQSILWGLLLLLPGDTFSSPSRVDIMSKYAQDHVWGMCIVLIVGPFLFLNRYRHTTYRKIVHIFLWTFWLGIGCLVIYRSSINGVSPIDFLLVIPFWTIALTHGIIYVGLGNKS